ASSETLSVTSNAVYFARPGNGIQVTTDVFGSGTTLAQTTFSIDLNTIKGVGLKAIYVANAVGAGSALTQGTSLHHATIDDNTISNALAGIVVSNGVAGAGASLAQVLDIESNTDHYVAVYGIRVGTRLLSGAVGV